LRIPFCCCCYSSCCSIFISHNAHFKWMHEVISMCKRYSILRFHFNPYDLVNYCISPLLHDDTCLLQLSVQYPQKNKTYKYISTTIHYKKMNILCVSQHPQIEKQIFMKLPFLESFSTWISPISLFDMVSYSSENLLFENMN